MNIRKIESKDLEDVIKLLQDISTYEPSELMFQQIFRDFSNQIHVNGYVFIDQDEIVGFGSIVYETKIRGGMVGHIEDIVVKNQYRGKSIGKTIIRHLTLDAKKNKCYKISLVCKEHNIDFYKKFGLSVDGFSMKKIL